MKAIKVKPVTASEIKDKKILHEAVAQVRRKPTQEDMDHVRTREEALRRVLAQ